MDSNGSHDIYEVKEIVGMKKVSGEHFYKVRWRGYGPENDTWEPQSNFFTCHDVIEEYKSKIKGNLVGNSCNGVKENENESKLLKSKINKVNGGSRRYSDKLNSSQGSTCSKRIVTKSNFARLPKTRLKKSTSTSSSSGLDSDKDQHRTRRSSTILSSATSHTVKRLTIKKETDDHYDGTNLIINSKPATIKLKGVKIKNEDDKITSCDNVGLESNCLNINKKSRQLNCNDDQSNDPSTTSSPVPPSLSRSSSFASSPSSSSSSSSSSSVSSSSSSSSSSTSTSTASIWSNVNYNLNQRLGSEGKTPLIRASEAGNVKLVEFLLDSGASKDVTDSEGNTALILASQNGHHDVVRSLLLYGANFSIINDAGSSALRTAKLFGNNETQHILTKHVSQITMALEKQVIGLLRRTAQISHALFPIQCHSSNENVRFRLLFNFDSIEPAQPGVNYLLFISDSTFSLFKPISLRFSQSSANVNVYLNRKPQKALTENVNYIFSFTPLRRGVNELLLTIKESKLRKCFIICAYQVTLLNTSPKGDIDI